MSFTGGKTTSPHRLPQAPSVSLVVPIWNEEFETLYELSGGVDQCLSSSEGGYELIFVDDGSEQACWESLVRLYEHHGRVKAIRLVRNFGQEFALFVGLRFARGEFLITLDSDLQIPPEVIPAFLKPLQSGCQLVYGVRMPRARFTRARRLGSHLYNLLMSLRWDRRLHDWGCGATAVRREVIDRIAEAECWSKPLKVLALECLSTPAVEVIVAESSRRQGSSKYSLWGCCKAAYEQLVGQGLGPRNSRDVHQLACIKTILQ